MNFVNEFGPAAYINRARKEGARDFGACMSPHTAFLVLQGMETLNLRMERQIKNTRDKEIRKFLRNFKFRRALSHALNRKAIALSIVKGPFLRSFAGGLSPGSLYFDTDSVVYYDYDPPSSKQLLDELKNRFPQLKVIHRLRLGLTNPCQNVV